MIRKIEVVPMDITPEIALEWLTRNTHNRPLRPAVIKAFKADILAGRVQETHEAIAFTERNIDKRILVDGQNRLTAIAELEGQDISVRLQVAFNVPLKAQEVINIGAKRSAVDQLIIEGFPATSVHISIARAMRIGKDADCSLATVVEFCRTHWKAIHYMAREFHSGIHVRGVAIAPVAGACARAFVVATSAERDSIRTFAKLLTRTDPQEMRDRGGLAFRHRQWLREQAMKETGKQAASRGEMYWRTIETLRQWLNRPAADRQPFAFPGESWS